MLNNHPNFDATFCGKLPLHQTNLIQPHGVLILVDKKENRIIQTSENIHKLTALSAAETINKSLADIVDEKSINLFNDKRNKGISGKLPLTFVFKSSSHTTPAHTILQEAEAYYMLEVELPEFIPASHNTFINVFQKVKGVMSLISAATSINEVCTIAAKELKALSGFDKVMVYHFDDDWNGSVLAEEKEPGMDTYMGLKFPASDIPKPARELYLKNPYRIIPNKDYEPEKLYPVFNPITNTFTNLSDCDLRSVAQVHLEYLKNMGVTASMSTRITHNESLWGLIACHHRTPKYLSFEEASVFEMLSNVISATISSLLNRESFEKKQSLNDVFTQLVEKAYESNDLVTVFKKNERLLTQLLSADGIAITWNNKIILLGETPDKESVETLSYWLQEKVENKVYHEYALPYYFDEATNFANVASGLMVLPVQADKRNFIMAFRPEIVKKVSWGGNPDEALTFEKNTTMYHPRASFSIWQEVVKNTSQPWLKEEIAVAETLRNFVIEFTLNKLN